MTEADAVALEIEATGTGRPDFPPTRPIMSLPRRDRAGLFRAVAPIREALSGKRRPDAGLAVADEFAAAAESLDLVQDIIDGVLVLAAEDADAMRSWADTASDAEVFRAFTWVMRDLGEANGSTGS